MSTVCAYQLEVVPRSGETSRACADAVWNEIAALIGQGCTQPGLASPELRFGIPERPKPHHLVWTDRQECATHRLFTFDWSFPFGTKGGIIGHYCGTLACDAQTVGLDTLFQVREPAFWLRPIAAKLVPQAPLILPYSALLTKLTGSWQCRVAGWPVPTRVRRLTTRTEVQQFLGDTLLSPGRTLPVVACALTESFTAPPGTLEALQQWLLGLAAVIALDGPTAIAALTQCVGHALSCEGGGVRIYWPRFTLASQPTNHRFMNASQLRELFKCSPLDLHLFVDLAEKSAAQFQEGPVVEAARMALAASRAEAEWPPQFTPAGDGTFTLKEADQLAVLRAALEQTNRDRNGALLQAQEAQRERDAAQTKLVEVRSERNAARNKLEQAERDRAAANRARDAAQRPLQEMQRQRDAAQTERQRATDHLASVETELKEVRQEREHFRKEWDAAQQRANARQKELADAQAQLADAREAVANEKRQNEFLAELESALHENERLRAAGEAARQRIVELEVELRNTKNNLAQLWGPPAGVEEDLPPPPAGEGPFTNVADALRAAAVEFADVLVVWEDAVQSAEASLFTSPAKVFQALRAIGEVGRAYFQARAGGPALGRVDAAFRSRVPFKYTGFESQTTLGHFGAERVFHHQGQSRQMQRHLTLGGGQTSNCLQIYFEFDDDAQRVLVGHCGRHLPFARQRT